MSDRFSLPERTHEVEVTIASGAGAVDAYGLPLVGIIMPSAWTAADLTFQISQDGATFLNFYDGGTEYKIIAAASRHILVLPADFASIRHIKVRSGTAGTPVNQAADRVLTLVLRPV